MTTVLLSGGQDSGTCLFWAKREIERHILPGPLRALTLYYGQRHEVEIDCARTLAAAASAEHRIFPSPGDDPCLSDLLFQLSPDNALQNFSADLNAASSADPTLPNSFVPGRNILFLLIATILDKEDHIVCGVSQTDYAGYPDCRLEFIQSMQETLRRGLNRPNIYIHTPLINLSKAETWKLAQELGVVPLIVEHTHTDYNGDRTPHEWGHGSLDNSASVLRASGYAVAKARGWI